MQQTNTPPHVVGGLGEKKSNGGSQYFQQDRVYDSDHIALCLPANLPGGSYRYLVDVGETNGTDISKRNTTDS